MRSNIGLSGCGLRGKPFSVGGIRHVEIWAQRLALRATFYGSSNLEQVLPF